MTAQSITNLANSLSDTGIAQDLLAVASNGVLTYAGAVQILQDVSTHGSLTQAEFSSLQSIASALNNGLTASSYVASVFSQLVDGSPLNAAWTGGQQNSTPLGNLAAGATTAEMNELTYTNLLGRAPESGAAQWYVTNIINPILQEAALGRIGYANAESAAHAAVLADISESHEFQNDVRVTAQQQVSDIHWMWLV